MSEMFQGIVAAGLTQYRAYSTDEVMTLLQQGNHNRTTEPTRANEISSRSHAILQVVVEYRVMDAANNVVSRVGKLSLIDLAGSERALATDQRTLRYIMQNKTMRALGEADDCGATNPIDRCWRCRDDWDTNRKLLVDCVRWFGRHTTVSPPPPEIIASRKLTSMLDRYSQLREASNMILEAMSIKGFNCLTIGVALENLVVIDCPDLTSINIFKDTCCLEISYCEDLESLPTFDESHSIRRLEIRGCPILQERCKKGSGPEWCKIQHILNIQPPRDAPVSWYTTEIDIRKRRTQGHIKRMIVRLNSSPPSSISLLEF
ncbi:hypothetical protein POM88_014018 [Heracleum sosnowskyi]|uniref:Kinesin-like protein n=1 Tax=Heracleum sosnowskyi TaxID=360622 RepID=A0AAD8J2X9_9APIA|nr:hypothetical protein POM88_014018 [Heracleum sosnowskyi]